MCRTPSRVRDCVADPAGLALEIVSRTRKWASCSSSVQGGGAASVGCGPHQLGACGGLKWCFCKLWTLLLDFKIAHRAMVDVFVSDHSMGYLLDAHPVFASRAQHSRSLFF